MEYSQTRHKMHLIEILYQLRFNQRSRPLGDTLVRDLFQRLLHTPLWELFKQSVEVISFVLGAVT